MSESLVEIGIENGIHIARVTVSNLDTLRGAELTDQLKVLVPRIAAGPLILDLSAVRFMQTQGLRIGARHVCGDQARHNHADATVTSAPMWRPALTAEADHEHARRQPEERSPGFSLRVHGSDY